jgi:integrase
MRIWKAIPGHPQGGIICKTTKSTKVPKSSPRADAERCADEMERIGNERPGAIMDRSTFERRVESLMRAAGVDVPRKTASWKDFVETFMDSVTAKESTVIKYRGELGQFSAFLGARASHDLRTISHIDIAGFLQSLKKSGRSVKTANNTTKTIRAALRRAAGLGYIDNNPAALVPLKNEGEDSTREPFTRDEMKRILAIVKGQERLAVLFGLSYGLRVGDAVSRRFEEISTRDGIRVISFIPQKKSTGGKVLTLPLVGELAKLPQKKTGFITPRIASMAHPGRFFLRVLADAGIDRETKAGTGTNGRARSAKSFHSLRHTISSWLMDSGADPRMRQLVCDHDDPKQNARYTHGNVVAMAEAITKAVNFSR